MTPLSSHLSQILEKCAARGITPYALAGAMGIRPSNIYRLRRECSAEMLSRALDAYAEITGERLDLGLVHENPDPAGSGWQP